MDAGAGLLEVLGELPGPTRVLCDVTTRLYDAPRLFGPQKGATPEQVAELEARFRADARLAPYADLPGAGAAGGLGAALASLGAELVPGAETVLDLLGFDPAPYTSSSPAKVRSTGRRGRGRRRRSSHGAAPRPAPAASSSAAWCSRAMPRRSAATRRAQRTTWSSSVSG